MKKILAHFFAALFALQPALAGVQNIEGYETGLEDGAYDPGGSGSDTVTSPVRTGTYALETTATTTGTVYHEVGCISAAGSPSRCAIATAYIRLYFRYATKAGSGDEMIFDFKRSADGTVKGFVTLTSGGVLKFFDSAGSQCGSTGGTTLSANTWYMLEAKIPNGTSAAGEIKVNGTSEITGTCNFLANDFGVITLGKPSDRSGQTIDYFYDDISISDSGYPGAGGITRLAPNADGSTAQWTSGTAPSDYTVVDEVPRNDDTDYLLKSAASSQTALVNFVNTGTAGISGTINAVRMYASVRTSAGTSATLVRISSSGTTSDTSTNAVGTSYTPFFKMAAVDPNTSAAWTTGGVDAMQGGVADTASISTVRCTSIAAMVDWTASSGPTKISVESFNLAPLTGIH